MFLITGQRETKKYIGYTADFCYYCRKIRAFRAEKRQIKNHLYFITYRTKSEPWTQQKCTTCKCEETVEFASDKRFAKKRPSTIDELIRETFPNIYSSYRDRLTLEKEVQRAPLNIEAKKRAELILEPFEKIEPEVEHTYRSSTEIDMRLLLIMLLGLILTSTPIIYASGMKDQASAELFRNAGLFAFIGAALAFFHAVFTASKRAVKKRYLTRVVRALTPLKPSMEELDRVKEYYRRSGGKMNKKWIHKTIRTMLDKNQADSEQFAQDISLKKGNYVQALSKKNE